MSMTRCQKVFPDVLTHSVLFANTCVHGVDKQGNGSSEVKVAHDGIRVYSDPKALFDP